MNKAFRMTGLVLVLGFILGRGYWQQPGKAAGQTGAELKQVSNKLKRLLSSAFADKRFSSAPAAPMATITVTSLADGAANAANCPGASCRLRDAIAKAGAGDTLNFSVTGTITLNSNVLAITKNLTIQGPGAAQLTLSGNNQYRVFAINSGFTVALSGLTIANGGDNFAGGGINNAGVLTLTNCVLTGNHAASNGINGGGINNTGTLTITGSTLSNNTAGNGGGINNTGTLTLTNSTLSANSVTGSGGGLYNDHGSVTITNSTFSGNTAGTSGGGLRIYFGSGTITNSTLSGNTANSGGGLYNYGNELWLITNCTITNNTAGTLGGGIYNDGYTVYRGIISAGNTVPDSSFGQDIYNHPLRPLTSLGYNLIGNNWDGNVALTTTTGDQSGTRFAPLNPQLAPLGNYGGTTQTHAPLPASPVINAGDNCVLTNACASNNLGFNLTTDQRGAGFNRQVGSKVDIGAYELQHDSSLLTINPASLPNATVGSAYNQTLSATGGSGSYTFSFRSGLLPTGLSLSATGQISGTPATGGNFSFTVMARDNSLVDVYGTRAYTLTIPSVCTTAPTGLVALWRAEGNARDTVASNHGTLQGSATFSTVAEGHVGQAFKFNGANGWVALLDNLFPFPTSGTGTTPFSFELWFKSAASGGVILGQQNAAPYNSPTGNTPAIYVGTDGKLRVEMFWNGTSNPLVSSGTVNDNTVFHHVAVTYDGTQQTVYLDGQMLGSRAHTQTAYSASYKYQLGTGVANSWPGGSGVNAGWFNFTGLIDEPSLYNRALTAQEVQALFGAGNAGKCYICSAINNTPPVLSYAAAAVNTGGSTTKAPTTATDDGSIAGYAVQSPGTYTGTISVNAAGVVSISNAAPMGQHTITMRATDNCGAFTDASFTLSVGVPNMNVKGNNLTVASGATTPSAADGTDFGSAAANTYFVAHSFTIENTGGAALNLTGTPKVVLSGTHAADFSIAVQPASPVAATNGTTTFLVNFAPTATGTRTATVSIASDDASHNPYTFAIQGTGTPAIPNGPACGSYTNRTTADGMVGNNLIGIYAVGSTVYATTSLGLSISTDSGTSFINKTTADGLGNQRVNGVYAEGSTVYVATGNGGLGGLSISYNGGVSFFINRTTVNGLGSNNVQGVYVAGGVIYAATTGGLAISTNGSTSFTNRTTANGLGSNFVYKAYVVDNTVYAATAGGLAISTNGGASFTNRTTANGLGHNVVWEARAAGSTVYAATNGGGLSISTDGGASFSNRTTANGLGSDFVYGVYVAGSTVYAATQSGLSISTDGGASFTNYITANGLGNNIVFGVSATSTRVYAATAFGLSFCSPPNANPTITPAATLTRQQGSPAGAAATIATVNDAETAAGGLTVAATTVPAGISVTGITNTNGTISATVAAGCNATPGDNTVVLTVTDGGNATATGNLVVNVTANAAPMLSYAGAAVNAGGSTTNSPAVATDNGSITGFSVQSPGTYTGTISVNAAGVVSLSNAAPVGSHTLTIRATDDCGATTDATFTLTVNNTAPTFTPAAALSRQQGSPAGSAVTVGTVSDGQTAAGSLTVTQIAGGAATGVTVTGITNTAGTITAIVTASCSAVAGTVRFQVSDGSLTGTGELTVNVTANTAPTLAYVAASVNAGAATNNSPTTATDNGSISSYAVQSPGSYTGTLAVNASGVVSITNAAPIGSHTITIRATDNCGTTTDATFTLTVGNNPPTITAGAALSRQQGSAGLVNAIVTVGDAETAVGSLVVTATTVPAGITITAITNTNGSISANVAAGCSATIGTNTVVLTVTDSNGGMATANLTVNVTANTAPTLTYAAASVTAGSATTVNPATASDNGSITGYGIVSIVPAMNTAPTINSSGVVSITNAGPSGNHTITVQATDNCGTTTDASFTLTVNCPGVTVNPATLSNALTGAAFSQTFTQTGGIGTLTWSLIGSAPPGLSFNTGTDTLSGAPTTSGSFSFTMRATDQNNCFGERQYTLGVDCASITVSPMNASLPGGTAGVPYSQNFTAAGGIAPHAFTISAGSLPPGLTLSAGGALSGASTGFGDFNFTVRATDANGCFGERAYTLRICGIITMTVALPAGTTGVAYHQTLTAAGGGAPYSFAVTGGNLPPGLSLNSSGALTGLPTQSGSFSFTLTATDNTGCAGAQSYTVAINCPTVTITQTSLPNGFVGTAYSQTLTASGGTAPYSFTVSTGLLPGGITLAAGGALSGIPGANGSFSFTIRATDANGCFGERAFSVQINGGGSGLQFYPLPSPVRLLETRAGFSGCTNPGNPINANDTLMLPVRTTCAGIPANAAAVTGNITVVPAGPGFLTLFPSTATQPTVANSNFAAGEITNNVFTVGLGAGDGAFKVFSSATTHVIVDVTGYYASPGTSGLYFHPLPAPVRLLETRAGLNGCITPGAPLTGTNDPNADPSLDLAVQGRVPVAAPCNAIPASAQVLVGNATSVFASRGGYLTIYPSGGTRPTVASSNYAGNDVINGPFAVKLGADGKFKVYTLSTTHLVIDILGYYSSEATDANGPGLLFNPLPSPVRLLETRPDFPGFPLTGCTRPNAPLVGNASSATHTQMAANFCGLPTAAQAVVGNVSVVNTTGAGFLTLFPASLTTAPLVATSNYPVPATFGYNRHFIVGLSPADGKFKVLTSFTTDLILDASGYFAP